MIQIRGKFKNQKKKKKEKENNNILYQEPFCCVKYLHRCDPQHIEPAKSKT